MKLSIIIPVYNVEQYLTKCLDSVIHQDIPQTEYEIIVVNDGSSDGSLAIAEQYASTHSNIKVISRENGGLSAARNTGLKEATGEYVWFIDSDDWIEPNVLNEILRIAKYKNLDILRLGAQMVYENGQLESYYPTNRFQNKTYLGTEYVCEINMPPVAWIALFRRDFLVLNNLYFYEGILHEDQEFTSKAFCLADRISFIDNVCYNYLQRQGSIMKTFSVEASTKRSKDYLTIADSLYCFTYTHFSESSNAQTWLLAKIKFCVFQSLSFYQKDAYTLDEVKDKKYYPLAYIKNESCKEKAKTFLANSSLSLYIFMNKMFK